MRRQYLGAKSLQQPLHCMLQGLAFSPPSLDLPTVIRLRLACQVLSKYINLDVLRPFEPARASRETNLTDKFIASFKEHPDHGRVPCRQKVESRIYDDVRPAVPAACCPGCTCIPFGITTPGYIPQASLA